MEVSEDEMALVFWVSRKTHDKGRQTQWTLRRWAWAIIPTLNEACYEQHKLVQSLHCEPQLHNHNQNNKGGSFSAASRRERVAKSLTASRRLKVKVSKMKVSEEMEKVGGDGEEGHCRRHVTWYMHSPCQTTSVPPPFITIDLHLLGKLWASFSFQKLFFSPSLSWWCCLFICWFGCGGGWVWTDGHHGRVALGGGLDERESGIVCWNSGFLRMTARNGQHNSSVVLSSSVLASAVSAGLASLCYHLRMALHALPILWISATK